MTRKLNVIIVAGGKGERMGAGIPKQFLKIAGKPILRHTMERFEELCRGCEMNMIVVLPAMHKEYWKDYCVRSGFRMKHRIVNGGLTRFHSVKNALELVDDDSITLVHDGVRPFVTKEMFDSLKEKLDTCKALIPVLPLYDSIRKVEENGESRIADRSAFVAVQTPQVFDSSVLKRAYEQPYVSGFTDDASVVESYGERIDFYEGSRLNIKITDPADLKMATALQLTFM